MLLDHEWTPKIDFEARLTLVVQEPLLDINVGRLNDLRSQ